MNSDSRARFVSRFATLAAERIERLFAQAARQDFGAMVGELHTLAGEAALLQLRGLAELARQGEALARKGQSAAECEQVLLALRTQIDALAK